MDEEQVVRTGSNKESFVKRMTKESIKSLWQKLPLKAKLIIIGVIAAIIFIILFLFFFLSVLMSTGVIDIGLSGTSPGNSLGSYQSVSENTDYWWPIGGTEVEMMGGVPFAPGTSASITITAIFAGNDSTHNGAHGALDIGATVGERNVIATKDGTVVYPTSDSQTRYGNGYLGCRDGGGYGNYVMIDHGDGMLSLYGHMYANTISVRAGDTVKQGQVLGKSGTSGNSTGGHLHFELRLNGKRVDPENYVFPNNPRPGLKTNNNTDNEELTE